MVRLRVPPLAISQKQSMAPSRPPLPGRQRPGGSERAYGAVSLQYLCQPQRLDLAVEDRQQKMIRLPVLRSTYWVVVRVVLHVAVYYVVVLSKTGRGAPAGCVHTADGAHGLSPAGIRALICHGLLK